MSYLKLIEDKIQFLAESLATALDVEITVTDKNLIRIAGTGEFYSRINENSPENSLFAEVLEDGKPKYDILKKDNLTCINCGKYEDCRETGNLIYPIDIEGEIIGVVSFASFNKKQNSVMLNKKNEYIDMLRYFSDYIKKEILRIKLVNRLNIGNAEINLVINSINRGIIILNKDKKIMHINAKAIKILRVNFSYKKIINLDISNIIKDIKLMDTNNKEVIDNWNISDDKVRVIYKLSHIMLDEENASILIDFESLGEIISIATKYNDDTEVNFDSIIGRSNAIIDVIEKAKVVSKSNSTIFLHGASGTGKELFAQSIHNYSLRSSGPFIAVNCATLPENLIESELFGYEKGAFTGASTSGKAGKFELANNGTLFLDEIADLPLHLQSKLLRVLQESKIYRLGGTKAIKINVRIVTATHKDLEQMIRDNLFREDLYYRLNVIPLKIPLLKDRENDVILCAEYIVCKLCNKMNKNNMTISKEVEEKFIAYNWPGNVRELENVLEYAIHFTIDNKIRLDNLPEYLLEKMSENNKNIDNYIIKSGEDNSLNVLTKDFEKKVLNKYIEVYGDTMEGKKVIARKLDLSMTTLYRKLNDYYS